MRPKVLTGAMVKFSQNWKQKKIIQPCIRRKKNIRLGYTCGKQNEEVDYTSEMQTKLYTRHHKGDFRNQLDSKFYKTDEGMNYTFKQWVRFQ